MLGLKWPRVPQIGNRIHKYQRDIGISRDLNHAAQIVLEVSDNSGAPLIITFVFVKLTFMIQ